ncbi:hypothetical protein HID58_070312 [Brassica napus]|uniref:BnaC06g07740D protein n=2 Tax=Brassica napus TaxID=3708 RepID=A0A078FSK6_BRANA|nr:UPF0301 protein CHU_1773 [Brassica napus]KAH0872950.1 hypothetical protein HID58_070312 [Brassica napus]CAF2056520.1 unnamed protein product [Brassica napus]CDY15288.1 BnaC06g07740D [Brassica napus]
MDLWTLDTAIRNPIFSSAKSIPEKSLSRKLGAVEIRFQKRKLSTCGYRSLVVRATSNKSNDDSSSASGGDASQENKSGDSAATPKPFGLNTDWREFRANLFMKEQEEKAAGEGHKPDTTTPPQAEPRGLKWAHPIPFPETGCVLVATEKLDGYRTFARTVVLLLRAGTNHPQEGPFGVVINRPLHKNIKHMKSTKTELATTFSECSLYFGGPLEASMFLLKTADKTKIPGLEEVMPGLNFGARNTLDEAAVLVKKGMLEPQDFRFFVGYAGWQLDQLREEIESDYWHVAACSSELICGASPENLWEEILQLMGGQYSELSRKPKLDM